MDQNYSDPILYILFILNNNVGFKCFVFCLKIMPDEGHMNRCITYLIYLIAIVCDSSIFVYY